MSRATGVARSMIGRGLKDLTEPESLSGAVRRFSGGGPAPIGKYPTLLENPRRRRTRDNGRSGAAADVVSKSHAKLAAALREMGRKIADSCVPKLLGLLEYRRRVNRKTLEGSHNPDRNPRSEHIDAAAMPVTRTPASTATQHGSRFIRSGAG